MNNSTTQYVTSFHYNFWSEQVCRYLLFSLLKLYFLVKFLYYIRNENKYKGKAERVDFYLKNPAWEFPHRIQKSVIFIYR